MYLPGVKANRYDRRLLSNLLRGLGTKIYDENQSCISLIVSKPDLLQQRHTHNSVLNEHLAGKLLFWDCYQTLIFKTIND